MSDVLHPMTVKPTLSLVVPVYNEEARLAESFAELITFIASFPEGSELVISDDGSTDDTIRVAEGLIDSYRHVASARVVASPHRGKGAAVRTGLATARAEYFAFCDVDLATPLEELERLLAISMIGPGLAIGSRDVVTSRRVARESATREFLGRTYNRLVRAVVTPGIYDTQCGAKVASAALWHHVLPYTRQVGFAWDVELVAVAKRLNFAVWEVGVEWSHDERSRVRTLRDGFAMVADVSAIWRNVRNLESLVGDDSVIAELNGSDRLANRARVPAASGDPLVSGGVNPRTLVERAV